jgi:hypothetical protein
MRGVFKGSIRVVAALAIATLLLTGSAFAESRNRRDRGTGFFLERAKNFIVSILGRIGGPPGDAEPAPTDGGS